ncbi:MAG TPA: hypothetical protein VK002_11440 [Rubricoccaceae bacterium]|nr:hypothetical protein [Rubricoccaceae bacterium]
MNPPAPDRWAEIDALFDEALARAPDERTAFLRAACGHDPALYRAVETLLASDEAAERALGEHATTFAARLLDAVAGEAEVGDLAPGTLVGPYRVVGEAGRGGMGVVYRARRADGAFEKTVALSSSSGGWTPTRCSPGSAASGRCWPPSTTPASRGCSTGGRRRTGGRTS